MPNKTEEYLALACKTADSFSRQWEHWAEFLITAARLYKYSYPDQLMIYAQRPDATACAEYDVWNNKMNRYVRRGSKGIALLDESGGYPRLHYVFDVSDTAPRRNALYPDLWQINDSLKEPVRSMLAENYDVHSESFGQQLADVAGKLVQSYWDNNSSDILGIVDGSYLMSYDDGEVISYNLSRHPNFKQIMDMLEGAFQKLPDKVDNLILHSDQGWQYQMKSYQNLLKAKGITQSMSRKATCLDNAVAENFFGLLKTELFYLEKFDSIDQLEKAIIDYIDYYNNRRIKLKLNGLSPVQYRIQTVGAA